MECQQCGSLNLDSARYCNSCGTRLENKAAVALDMAERTPVTPKGLQRKTIDSLPIRMEDYKTLDSLGVWVDGWADLVDGASHQVEELRQFVTSKLKAKKTGYPPRWTNLSIGAQARKRRDCLVLQHTAGASLVLNITAFGNDLYLSWHMFTRTVWRTDIISIILGVTVGVAVLLMGITDGGLFVFFTSCILLLFLVFGMIWKYGRFVKGNPWAVLQEEYDHFRVEEITAMMLGVHKTLLAGLDHIGVDSSLLRKKDQFHAGSRERII